MSSKFRLFSFIIIVALCVSLFFNVSSAINSTPEPGSAEDPLISKSYVDAENIRLRNEISLLKSNYDASIASLNTLVEQLKTTVGSSNSGGFEVVSIETGTKLFSGAGTEIMLRSGKAIALKGINGNLADATSAADLKEGNAVTINHLLISSRDDGRGIKASTLCYLLVRGAYVIEKQTSAPAETTTQQPAVEQPVTNVKTGIVTASSLRVRLSSSASSEVVGSVSINDTVVIIDEVEGWYKIKVTETLSGWVASQYISVAK